MSQVDTQFQERLHAELHGQHQVGMICATFDFDRARTAEWIRVAAVSDATRRLRQDLPECDWMEAHQSRIRLLVHGSVADLVSFAERALRCLKRTAQMEGAVPLTLQVSLTVAAAGEQPGALIGRGVGGFTNDATALTHESTAP